MGIKLWELIKWCSEGAYVQGDLFTSGDGSKLYFDGEKLIGVEFADLSSVWFYWKDGFDGINA